MIIPLPDLESQKKIADQYYAKLSEIKELKIQTGKGDRRTGTYLYGGKINGRE